MSEWVSAAVSEIGQRPNNEDRYWEAPGLALWAVADGMGGHAEGELASEIALQALSEAVQAGQPLAKAVTAANRFTCQEARRRSSDMGTTLVALRLHPDHYEVAWLGDSRAYLWNGHELQRLTTDHTVVQRWVEEGRLSLEGARGHPYGHVLTQAVGLDPEADPGYEKGSLDRAWAFLLCTDGLSDALSDERIGASLSQDSGSRALDALAREVRSLADPFQDNMTAILVYRC